MNGHKRQFDLIVLGATGFTGHQASEYLSQYFPGSLRWAISGRNQEKLGQLQQALSSNLVPPSEHFVLDHQDEKAVREVVAKAKVILNFAGPFARLGGNVVAACAQLGTHYLDITGETHWVKKMIDLHERSAQKSGAILIPLSGFDSVPFDLGVWEVLKLAKKKNPKSVVTKIVSLISMRGGLNGGTFETFLDMLEAHTENASLNDPLLLVPKADKKQFPFKENRDSVFLKDQGITAPPFFMSPVNTAVVYRSQSLRMTQGDDSQPPFEYLELQNISGGFSKIKSRLMIFSSDLLNQIGRRPLGRKVLRLLGPKPGEGPSAQVRESGFFKARFFAYSHEALVSKSEIYFRGDPGNKATVALICESARCLIFNSDKLPKIPGGFWTSSTALGSTLRQHLISAGFKLS